jgi:uncharacterized protein YndB with AHSA1/START domain
MLPREHVASGTLRLGRTPQVVWDVLVDFPSHPTWRTGLKEMRRMPDRDGLEVWQEVGRHGPLTYQIVEAVPPERLVMRIADPELPFGGTWTYELEPVADGCEVTITERGEIKNPAFRFLARYVFGHDSTLSGFLADLRGRMERTPAVGPASSRSPYTNATAFVNRAT